MDAATYFQNEPGFRRAIAGMIDKYRSYGRIGGRVQLTRLTAEEKEALSLYFRKDLSGRKTFSFTLVEFDRMLQETRFTGTSLFDLLETLAGEPLLSRQEARERNERQKQALLERVEKARVERMTGLDDSKNDPGRAPSQSDYAAAWLQALKVRTPARRWHQQFEADPEQLERDMLLIVDALHDLAMRPRRPMDRLPFLAERIAKQPHAFDPGTPLGNLLIEAMRIVRDRTRGKTIADPAQDTVESGTEALTELYYHFGILRDDLMNYVTCCGIAAWDERREPLVVWTAALNGGSVLNVPLREMGKVAFAAPGHVPPAGSTGSVPHMPHLSGHSRPVLDTTPAVYVVENSGVFSALLDRWPYPALPPIIGTFGQFKLAALLLLDRLVENGAFLHYSGDFDPEGLQMADFLLQRYPGRARPWRYTVDDYNHCQSTTDVSQSRLAKLDLIRSAELMDVAEAVRAVGKAGYQEGIIDRLAGDLLERPATQ